MATMRSTDYMMIREPGPGTLRGCWRLLPTEGPYMLKDSFPELLHGAEAPDACARSGS